MIPAAFDYRSPESVDEALALLGKYRDEAKLLAGGHSLIPALKLRLAAPAVVVDLRRIPGFTSMEAVGSGLRIGALVTHHEVETSPLVKARCPLLAEAAGAIGDAQVRNVGTLVGSVCHADPAADYPAALLALDAEVMVRGPGGERRVKIGDFVQGVLETALEPTELACAIVIPEAHPSSAAYLKMRQSASGFALAGAAAQLTVEAGVARQVAIGITGVAERPFRAAAAEAALTGKKITLEGAKQALQGIAKGRELLSDMHASSDYRAHLAEVYACRALMLALSRS